jgi:hypothetical protein
MTYIPLIILSLFFVQALYRYGKEALRLNRLVQQEGGSLPRHV